MPMTGPLRKKGDFAVEELREIVAHNLSELRRRRGMTQAQLAEALNYSDKAISKWERGESLPDVAVLKQISELFQVPLDYLVEAEHESEEPARRFDRRQKRNRVLITGMSIMLVWLIATLLFTNFNLAAPHLKNMWQLFVYAVPVSSVVWLVFNSLWFNRKWNFLIISLLLWSALASVCLTLFPLNFSVWQVLAVGIPGQVIILLWSGIRPRRFRKKEKSGGETS